MAFLIWVAVILLALSTRINRRDSATGFIDLDVTVSLKIASDRIDRFTQKLKSLTKEK